MVYGIWLYFCFCVVNVYVVNSVCFMSMLRGVITVLDSQWLGWAGGVGDMAEGGRTPILSGRSTRVTGRPDN
jgi:hypothetical protein